MEGDTKEDKTNVKTEKISITSTPLPNGIVKSKTGSNTSDTVYNDWYKAVYMPSTTPASTETDTGA